SRRRRHQGARERGAGRQHFPLRRVHHSASQRIHGPQGHQHATVIMNTATDPNSWLNDVVFDESGLIPAIAQDGASGTVLMVAWMNRDALAETAATGHAVYWSRSRRKLWRKGEESGHRQVVRELRLDCDGDVILLKVEQVGGIACHT